MLSDQISVETEKVMDEAMVNLEEGKAGEPIELKEQPTPDLAAKAAHNLPGMLTWFKYMVSDKLMGTQAKKILVALSEYPFNGEELPNFTTEEQSQVYNVGIQIQNAKLLILMKSLRDESQRKKEESPKTENKEEKTNG